MNAFFRMNKSHWLYPCLAVVTIWLLFVYPVLGPEHSFAVFKDNEFLLGPLLSHMSSVIRAGEWPLWMDTILAGAPTYNLTQFSAYYPLYFLPFPIFGDPFEASRSMHLIILAHLLIFLANSYVLVRAVGVSRVGALAGAVLVALNANTLAYSTWINIVSPYAWLPLYVAGVIRLLDSPNSIRAQAMTLFAIVMLTLASPAQPLIHAVLITVVLASAHGIRQLMAGTGRAIPRAYATLLGVAIVAMLLAAPVLVPAVADFGDMIRWIGAFPAVMGNERIPFEAFLTDQISPNALIGVVFRVGDHLAVGSQYIGLLPLALAAFAVFSPRRHWVIVPLAFLAVYALLSSTGSHLGFAQLNYEIPLVNKIREPSRFLFVAHFAIGILAALGIDAMVQFVFSRNRDEPIRGLIAATCVLLTGIAVSLSFWSGSVKYAVLVVPLASTIGVLGLVVVSRVRRRLTAVTVTAICATIVIATQWLLVPWRAPEVAGMEFLTGNMVGPDEAIKVVAKHDPGRQYRVIFEGDIDNQKAAMLASYHGVRTFNAAINPAPYRQFKELYYHAARNDNYFRAAGAKFVLCRKCVPETVIGYRLLETIGDFSLYESDALPRTYFSSGSAGEFFSLAEYAGKMAPLDLRDRPVLTSLSSVPSSALKRSEKLPCIQSVSKFFYNSVSTVLQCDSGAIFVLNEFYNGNWQARVDGVKVQPQMVNGNQIAVTLTPGSHRVEFSYYPHNWVLGLRGLAIGLLLMLFYLVFRAFRKSTASGL